MNAHTPGPWEFDAQCGEVLASVPRGKSPIIAFARRQMNGGLADGYLLAAAPELLEALKMVLDADNDCHMDGLQTIPSTARAAIDYAIAKATGGEK